MPLLEVSSAPAGLKSVRQSSRSRCGLTSIPRALNLDPRQGRSSMSLNRGTPMGRLVDAETHCVGRSHYQPGPYRDRKTNEGLAVQPVVASGLPPSRGHTEIVAMGLSPSFSLVGDQV